MSEPAKTEEKEKEDGTKETVERVEPAKKKVKVVEASGKLSVTSTPLWTKHPNECSDEEYQCILS